MSLPFIAVESTMVKKCGSINIMYCMNNNNTRGE